MKRELYEELDELIEITNETFIDKLDRALEPLFVYLVVYGGLLLFMIIVIKLSQFIKGN